MSLAKQHAAGAPAAVVGIFVCFGPQRVCAGLREGRDHLGFLAQLLQRRLLGADGSYDCRGNLAARALGGARRQRRALDRSR